MLYKKNIEKTLSQELFCNPTAEYRGTPFWAWNGRLEKEELCRQIDIFKEMGLGGFHMHVRTGLETQYLSDEFMTLIRTCVNKAKDSEMLAWLYDEDRWPSGAAGGFVTKEEKYRARYLLFTPFESAEVCTETDANSKGGRNNNGRLLACYDVTLDESGFLKSYRKIGKEENAYGTKWYAFLEICSPSEWYNDKTYADTLNAEAIKRFTEITHERYKEIVGDEFDRTIPAIFTDEPQFTHKKRLNNSFDKMDLTIPWTDRVPEIYREIYSADILETLPELFWDLPQSAPSVHRYRYHDFISELFASSFADTVGKWCSDNNLALTGHMMEEPRLDSQTTALGEAMRSYRSFTIPGIDMLCNRHEFTTAKQAQSAAHQYGREGVMSELYGVTGWDCDFQTYKHQGDWQAALGVTVRVPHLSWYTMKGEAKRDYPASISFQSPWYKEYPLIEDHFARVNTAMTRGKPVVKVGVIHPVESFWLHFGPNDKSALLRESLDERFENITKWLIEGSIDFDFISESLLPAQCEEGSNPLKVGQMEYDAVVVPGCETLRSTTLERLEKFRQQGGTLIFMGEAPKYCDAAESLRGKELSYKSVCVDFSRSAILSALEKHRTLTIRFANGRLSDKFIYQLRKDGGCSWLFISPDREPKYRSVDRGDDIQIILEGEYSPVLYNTSDGSTMSVPAEYRNGKTIIRTKIFGYDSLLFRLSGGRSELSRDEENHGRALFDYPDFGALDYELSEDNVLLLDMAQYKLDIDKEFLPEEEMLRLDNICREKLGIRKRGGRMAQPWATLIQTPKNKITLRFVFESEIDYEGAILALEDADKAQIVFNSKEVGNSALGYYVDPSISKVRLGNIIRGINTLDITYPFGVSGGPENVFILGDFGVKLHGRNAVITEKPKKIYFGDIQNQGFPFYGGNITYKLHAVTGTDRLSLCVSDYRGALIKVKADGKNAGDIIYPPYILTINGLKPGEHEIELELFTYRYNTFGPVHLSDRSRRWHGPDSWRSTGIQWSYEYYLSETGILSSPGTSE